MKESNSLAIKNPELAKEWHPTLNGQLKPTDVTYGSGKKIWWQCPNSKLHDYEATISNRSIGTGCPYCTGFKVCADNNLAFKYPDIVKEWHPTKNGELKPTDVTAKSSKKVWWRCPNSELHDYEATIANHSNGTGCPYCAGKKVCADNNLSITHPHIAEQWHPTKNEELKSTNVTYGMTKKVWWQCSKNSTHEWNAIIDNRSKGSGCPHCQKEQQTSFPEQAIYFYIKQVFPDALNRFTFEDSKLELDIYIPQLNIGIEYDGSHYHQHAEKDEKKSKFMMEQCTFIRVREEKCPPLSTGEQIISVNSTDNSLQKGIEVLLKTIKIITNESITCKIDIQRDRIAIYELMELTEKENSFAIKYPDIVKEWHPTKNGELKPTDVTAKSNKKVWWQCPNSKLHDYEATISNRSIGTGCPYCAGQKVCADNNLAFKYPDIVKEWHPTKNGELKPTDVTAKSGKRVWWQCPNSELHDYESTIANRSNGKGCPYCAGQKVCADNNLKVLYPELAKEWHPTKNGILKPTEVTSGSNKKVWWRCSNNSNHEWNTKINHRSKGTGCPYCAGRRVCADNNLSITHPSLVQEWHPILNGALQPSDVTHGMGKKIWWLCSKNPEHEWDATINHRSKGNSCPHCYKEKRAKSV